MRNAIAGRAWVLLCVALVACQSDEEPTPDARADAGGTAASANDDDSFDRQEPTESVERSLCPTCRGLPGGETGNFSDPCENVPLGPLDAELEHQHHIAELRAQLDEPLTAPAKWIVNRRDDPSAIDALPHMNETEVEIEAQTGDFAYYQICNTHVAQAPVELHLRVADGTLEVAAHGTVQRRSGRLEANIHAVADLSAATGNLQVAVDESRPHLGAIGIDFNLLPAGVRGQITPYLFYFTSEDALQAALTAGPSEDNGWPPAVQPIALSFPLDHCGEQAMPIDPEAEQATLGGHSASELLAAAIEQASALPPASAGWLDGSSTELETDFESVQGDDLCLGTGSVMPANLQIDLAAPFPALGILLEGWSGARIYSSDGRLDARLAPWLIVGGDGTLHKLGFSLKPYPTTRAEVAEQLGFELPSTVTSGFVAGAEVLYTFDVEPPRFDALIDVRWSNLELIECIGAPLDGQLARDCLEHASQP